MISNFSLKWQVWDVVGPFDKKSEYVHLFDAKAGSRIGNCSIPRSSRVDTLQMQ